MSNYGRPDHYDNAKMDSLCRTPDDVQNLFFAAPFSINAIGKAC